jgi:hydrogenase maturation protease
MKTEKAVAPILAVGCGNPDAGQDCFGVRVADALQRMPCRGLEVCTLGMRPADLLDQLPGRAGLIVLDAARRTGTSRIGPFDLDWYGAERRDLNIGLSLSSHGQNIAYCLSLADELGWLPPRVRLLGVTIQDALLGGDLGEACAYWVPEVARRALQHARAWLAAVQGASHA